MVKIFWQLRVLILVAEKLISLFVQHTEAVFFAHTRARLSNL